MSTLVNPVNDSAPLNPHQDLAALLPWYVSGTLSPAESTMLERHLTECSACRIDLAQCRQLAAVIQDREADWQPAPDGFARLMAGIDRLETPPVAAKAAAPGWLTRMRDWLRATPNPVRWTLALESMAVAALLLMVALPLRQAPVEYETLSSSIPTPATTGPRAQVVFAATATISELHTLLRAIDGQIVAGPSALGVYTVALPTGTLAPALATLRGDARVRLAEPLDHQGPTP